jgi:hypothetical protein
MMVQTQLETEQLAKLRQAAGSQQAQPALVQTPKQCNTLSKPFESS